MPRSAVIACCLFALLVCVSQARVTPLSSLLTQLDADVQALTLSKQQHHSHSRDNSNRSLEEQEIDFFSIFDTGVIQINREYHVINIPRSDRKNAEFDGEGTLTLEDHGKIIKILLEGPAGSFVVELHNKDKMAHLSILIGGQVSGAVLYRMAKFVAKSVGARALELFDGATFRSCSAQQSAFTYMTSGMSFYQTLDNSMTVFRQGDSVSETQAHKKWISSGTVRIVKNEASLNAYFPEGSEVRELLNEAFEDSEVKSARELAAHIKQVARTSRDGSPLCTLAIQFVKYMSFEKLGDVLPVNWIAT